MSTFKRMEPMQQTQLRDLLFNMHQSSGASDDYRKGIIVGTVGAMMVCGLTWKQAIEQICFHMPDAGAHISHLTVPESWFVDIGKQMNAYGKTYINPV